MRRRTAQLNSFIHYHYFKTMMISGLIKSVVGTIIIGAGITVIVNYLSQPAEYAPHTPLLGIGIILLGAFVYFIGDIYKIYRERQREQKLQRQYMKHLNKEIEEICGDITIIKEHMGIKCEEGYCDHKLQETDEDE